MFKKIALLASLFSAALVAQEIKTPEEIQAELDQAQKDFEIAQEIFIPWYTGPLITSSANNVPAGKYNIQGYLYFESQYAQFDNERQSQRIPTIFTLQPLLILQAGLTHWLDFTIAPQGFFRWQEGHSAQEFGDLSTTFGFQIVKETPHIPSIRLTLAESFPTGKFQRLSPNKGDIDATGSGAFETIVGLNISKVIWWMKLHPMSVRFSTTYEIPNHKVDVKGFNAYGGGFGTKGKINVGDTFNADFGIEISITEKWVYATDFAYFLTFASTFSGSAGITAEGIPATNGTPFSDQVSIAPAIEYNVSSTGGFIGGVWLPLTGKNSANFFTVILSYTQLF